MSFAFRYSLPKEMDYQLHIGSGPIDPQTGYPPSQIDKVITQDEPQKTLIVNLEKMPTEKGNRWTIQCIDGLELSRMICNDEFEFTWLQAYLAAFPTDDQVGSGFNFRSIRSARVQGHGKVNIFDSDKEAILYMRGEFHQSALESLTEEMRRDRETFMIWLEPIIESDAKQSGSSAKN